MEADFSARETVAPWQFNKELLELHLTAPQTAKELSASIRENPRLPLPLQCLRQSGGSYCFPLLVRGTHYFPIGALTWFSVRSAPLLARPPCASSTPGSMN